MSEMDIHQIFKLNFYKKLQELWTDDVDGDCFSLNLKRNTESLIFLLKRLRGDYKKKFRQIYQQRFYLEELTQIEWLVSKKQNNGRAYETKFGDKEQQFDYYFEFDTNSKSRFVKISFDDYPNLVDFRLFILQNYKNKTIKTYNFAKFLFSLFRNRLDQ